jgi:sterol 3beta-glucosyltransferase
VRILITSFGTRGDIQPYAALAKALKERGHEVALAVPEGFRDLADRAGVTLHPAGNRLLTQVEDVMPQLSGARDALTAYGTVREAMREQLDEIWDAARSARPDLIVYHPKTLAGPHVAEALGIPGVLSLPLPFYTPTRAFPIPLLGGRSLGRWANRASYYPFTRMATVSYGGMINDFRRQLGLRGIGRLADPLRNPDGTPVHVLYPYSAHVVPVPDDYPPTAHVTGYWFLDAPGWQPTPQLADFLQAGPPPVYVGFGSMGFGKGADQRRDAILAALHANRLRGIVATGWGGIAPGDPGTDDILMVDAIPHDWLFPRVAAVVHHGGAGTTAAGLRAGKPTLICPFLADQPFWGARIHAIGAGPQPLPHKHLTGGPLATRLNSLVSGSGYRRRAGELRKLVTAKDGAAAAVHILDEVLPGRPVHQ